MGACCGVRPGDTVRHVCPGEGVEPRGKLGQGEDDGPQAHHQDPNTYRTNVTKINNKTTDPRPITRIPIPTEQTLQK